MESRLLYVSLAIGWVCWLCGFLTTRLARAGAGQGSGLPRLYVVMAIALPILVFLATLPGRAPFFAVGHGFGNGFLLGGAGALLAGWTILRAYRSAQSGEPASRTATVAAPCALASAIAVIPLLWMRGAVLDALMGSAIGWLCIAFLLIFALRQEQEAPPGDSTSKQSLAVNPTPYLLALAANAGFAVLVCALGALGELREPILTLGKADAILHWSSAGMVLAAGVSFLLLLTSLPTFISMRLPLASLFTGWIGRAYTTEEQRQAAARGGRVAFYVLALIAIGKLLAGRYTDKPEIFGGPKPFFLLKPVFWFLGSYHLFHVLFLGLLTGLIVWWVTAGRIRQEREAMPVSANGWQNSALAVLALVSAIMVAFQLMGGFGIGVLLTAAWPVAALALSAALETESLPLPTGAVLSPTPVQASAPVPPPPAVSIVEEWNRGNVNVGAGGENSPRPASPVPPRPGAMPPERPSAATPLLAMATHLLRLMLFGVGLLLYRLFEARFQSELRGVSLTDHYALFGLLFGAMLPPVLAGYLLRMTGSPFATTGGRLLRIVIVGILALLLPMIVLTLWGAKCALALLIGLALSVAITETSLLPALFALAVGLALTQWTHHILPLSQLTRDQKTHALFVGGVIILILIALADYGGRFLTGQKGSKSGSAARPVPGGAVQ